MKLLRHSGRGFVLPLDLLAAGATSKMSKGAAVTRSKLSWAPSGPDNQNCPGLCREQEVRAAPQGTRMAAKRTTELSEAG